MSKNFYGTIVEQAENKYGKGTARSKVATGKHFSRLLQKAKKENDPLSFSLKEVYESVVDPDGVLGGPGRSGHAAIAEAITHSAMPYIVDSYFTDLVLGVYEDYAGQRELSLVTEGDAGHTDFEEIPGFGAHEELALRGPSMPYEESDIGDKKVGIFYWDFGRIVSLTWEVIYNDQTGQVIDRVNRLANKAMQKVAKGIIQTLEMGTARSVFDEAANKGFYYNGSTVTASGFYSTDHSAVIDLQTNANYADHSGAGVTWATLAAAYNLFADMVDDRGEKITIVPDTLVIPPGQTIETFKLLGASYVAQDAHGATADTTTGVSKDLPNFFKNKFNVVESAYLADSADFFLGVPKNQLQLNWVEKPTTASQGADSDLAFSRKIVYRFKVNTHFGVANTDYRWVAKID